MKELLDDESEDFMGSRTEEDAELELPPIEDIGESKKERGNEEHEGDSY